LVAVAAPSGKKVQGMALSSIELKKWEHPKGSGIKIREIQNAHAGLGFNTSYLVTVPARLTGKDRDRKQFKEKAAAESWAKDQHRGAAKQGEDFFRSTADERRAFVEVLPILRKKNLSLREVVDFAVPRLRPDGHDRSVAELVTEMVAAKKIRADSGQLRPKSYSDFRLRAEKISKYFGDTRLRDLRGPEILEWLRSLELSPKSNKNYLNIVSELLSHAMQRKLIVDNPLDELSDLDRKELTGDNGGERQPGIFKVHEVERILSVAKSSGELEMLPFLVLGFFCGLRTEELKRLDWKDVRLSEKKPYVTVGGEIAKKRRIRNVEIPDNACSWLRLCHKESGEIVESRYECQLYRRIEKILEEASNGSDPIKWVSNGMRHSFASYHYALHGDSVLTSRLLGHKSNDDVLFAHYRSLATEDEGKAFFSITPN
jgi:integrase